jgi:hypothetical protein
MKKHLLLLFFIQQPVLSMYPPVDIGQSAQSLAMTYEILIKSLHDSHISDFMYSYPRAAESRIFKRYFRALAHRAAFRHPQRRKGYGFDGVARHSLSYPLSRQQADPVLQLLVKKRDGNTNEIEKIKDMYYQRFHYELAQVSMNMMKMLYE